jgi:hypothetical protein
MAAELWDDRNGMHLLILGAIAIATIAAWALAWSRVGVLSEHSFFPLWLGYILTMNGISVAIFQTSLLRVMRGGFFWLFVASVRMWFFSGEPTPSQLGICIPVSDLRFTLYGRGNIDFSTAV